MKKVICIALCLALSLCLVACGAAQATPASAPAESTETAVVEAAEPAVEPVTFKLNTANPTTSTWYAGCAKFAELVQEKTNGRYIADCICESLLEEVRFTPKPGLVDSQNSGAHRDMTLEMFEQSAYSLRPFFFRMFEI